MRADTEDQSGPTVGGLESEWVCDDRQIAATFIIDLWAFRDHLDVAGVVMNASTHSRPRRGMGPFAPPLPTRRRAAAIAVYLATIRAQAEVRQM